MRNVLTTDSICCKMIHILGTIKEENAMKKEFEAVEIEVIRFESTDVIITSPGDDNNLEIDLNN